MDRTDTALTPRSPMPVKERRDRIVELVMRDNFMSVESLAALFHVTPQTIRRDIVTLDERGRIRRIHGGASVRSSVENLAYSARQVICLEQKRRIGRAVADALPDRASLILNIGTTTEAVARALVERRAGLRIITNNLNIAAILRARSDFEVMIAGGTVRHRDGGVVGESAMAFIRQFKVDFGIIGISGIDDDGTLLDYDFREVQVAHEIVQASRRTWLVADHTKFGRTAMVKLGSLTAIDALFTDRTPPDALMQAIAGSTCIVHVAS